MKRLNNKKGFTLMEMLIVIAIIAVLVTILVPAIGSSLRKAREAADVANLRAAYAQYQLAWVEGKQPQIFISGGKVTISETDIMGDTTAPTFEATINFIVASGNPYGADKVLPTGVNPTEITIVYKPKELNNGQTYEWKLPLP